MRMAMAAAREAFALGEVPVGAVTVHEPSGTILATAHNETERRMVRHPFHGGPPRMRPCAR